jgi:NADPH:quinone reductase-like Zn-dependent oxidoreductase
MNSILLTGPGEFGYGQIPTPQPTESQILIKVDGAVLNPSDTLFMRNQWMGIQPKEYPFTPGWEGSGVVIKAGSDNPMATALVGKRVAFGKG